MDLTMDYTPKEWEVYELGIHSEYRVLHDLLTSEEETGLVCCGSDSELAINHFKRIGSILGLFFFDTEQIFMDLDKTYGQMALGNLTHEWRGHPAGSLVFAVAKGAENGKFTVGVEKTTKEERDAR